MCEFLSFKIERTPDGLIIRTAESLSDHSDIPDDGYEGEWTDDKLEIRVPPGTSANVADELAAFVKKTYKTRQKMADKLIVQYLKDGKLPGYFWEHSKLDDRKLRLFACDCAERVLPLFEKQSPDDKRPRNAIEVSRKFANGQASDEELAAVRDAARAAGDAAWATGDAAGAAGDAAGAAAGNAGDAAGDAGDAAGDAIRAAARAAGDAGTAAWDAGTAAWAAARDAARATGDAEKKEQAAILLKYIHE